MRMKKCSCCNGTGKVPVKYLNKKEFIKINNTILRLESIIKIGAVKQPPHYQGMFAFEVVDSYTGSGHNFLFSEVETTEDSKRCADREYHKLITAINKYYKRNKNIFNLVKIEKED
jgi:hypothetical protein